MAEQLDPALWMPITVTIGLMFLLVFAVASLASNTIADLVGLAYLLASPLIYRALRTWIDGTGLHVPSSFGVDDAT